MRTESRELLAVGILGRKSRGSKSRLGERIEMLLRRGRTFSPRTSSVEVAASAVLLGGLMLAGSLVPRWIAFAQQSSRPSFEVASIKPNNGSSRLVHVQPSPGGRFNAENVSLRFLMQHAYDVKDFQIVGGPAWINSDRYDLSAKAEGTPTGQQMMGPMLQTLLEDRFKLAIHRETHQLPIYALTVAKSGLKLRPAKEGSCTAWSPFSLIAPSSPVRMPGENAPKPCGFLGFGVQGLELTLDMSGASMAELSASLAATRELHQTVLDNTGLAGVFDVHLKWTADSPGATDSGDRVLPNDAAGPFLFSALQEQLGLKLESAKGPLEVLVIDHVEKPDAN
jgi:uncharacterized protein (TIGR03435 family)